MLVTEFDIGGVGVWSEHFLGWDEFRSVMAGAPPAEHVPLKPKLIPARERRRAPMSVKMAVEVMDQACRMANLEPTAVAIVFAGVYGDIQITDYMCRTLANAPLALSPTRFHNSVHNAATGYWAIATKSCGSANAISAYEHSYSMALLEAAVQAVEEDTPVIMTMQELAAPAPFKPFYDADVAMSAALAMFPKGRTDKKLASAKLEVRHESCALPNLPDIGGIDWGDNYAACILPLLGALAEGGCTVIEMPISGRMSLSLELTS